MNQNRQDMLAAVGAFLLPWLAGGIGGLATSRSVSSWYRTLRKPWFTPPGWLISPIWFVLYLLMGAASWWVWQERETQAERVTVALRWYGLQLGLNALWSVIFFGWRQPGLAFLEIMALWGVLLKTVMQFSRIHGEASWLLVPYQLWVTFAALINGAIWWLNRPGR